MSIEWVNRAIDRLRAWGREKGVEVDIDEIRLLCDYASDYLDVHRLGDFRPSTFEELLLEIYPRKVIAPPESAPETIAAARTLVDFLLDQGEIGEDVAARMRETIDRIEPEMPHALADTSKFGMAKSLFSSIGPEALDGPMPGELAAEEGGAPDAGLAPLPPVRLPPAAELAAAVREVPLLRDAFRVAAWLTEGGRTTTTRKTLRVRDAKQITAELGIARPQLPWRLALHLGLIRLDRTAIVPGEAFRPLPGLPDDEVLRLWARMVAFLVDPPVAVTGDEVVDDGLFPIHDLLYRMQAPVPQDAIGEYLKETLAGDRPMGPIGAALAGLAEAGTVHVTEEGVTLTPHGLWGMRELYTSRGMDAPIAADPSEGDASTLIAGLVTDSLPEEEAERCIQAWLARRDPQTAADELLSAVVGAPAEVRGVAVSIVDRLGPEAAPAVRSYLDDPELRPHAIHWLSSRGLDAPPLTHEELLWVSVDMLALALPAAEADPETFAENIAASGPSIELIEEMWKVDHPDVVEVLEMLSGTLTDPDAAKAARKAAMKARSRAIRRPPGGREWSRLQG